MRATEFTPEETLCDAAEAITVFDYQLPPQGVRQAAVQRSTQRLAALRAEKRRIDWESSSTAGASAIRVGLSVLAVICTSWGALIAYAFAHAWGHLL